MQQGIFNAASLIPHVNNGRVTPSAASADALFAGLTRGIGANGAHEVHDVQRNAVRSGKRPGEPLRFTFDWVYAAPAPLRNPHF